MLEKVHSLRNELMEMNLGNNEIYLVRDNLRFSFHVNRDRKRHIDGFVEMSTAAFCLWDDNSRSIGQFIISDVHIPPSDDFIDWIEEVTKLYCDGFIHCSRCGRTIKQSEIAGRYFAGVYCQECWEGGMREIEARETYD